MIVRHGFLIVVLTLFLTMVVGAFSVRGERNDGLQLSDNDQKHVVSYQASQVD